MPLGDWLPLLMVFILGAIMGSFLNVCIHRLPLEKSILWPGSRCGNCFQPIRWYDNIPLVSYWLLGGRCRTCGARFSLRYFAIELLTGLCFAGLFYLAVVENVHQLAWGILGSERFLIGRLVIFGYHAVLLCFLLVATFTDFDRHSIPLPLTITGTLVGLAGAVVWPWPWPYRFTEVLPALQRGPTWALQSFPSGLYPWPVWWPLPAILKPGGDDWNWRLGLATGLAGIVMGTMLLRAIRFLFGLGRGAELMEPEEHDVDLPPRWLGARWWSWVGRVGGKAMGLGDADLMMMAGAFLGWQPVLVAFFVGVIPGLALGLFQLVRRGNQPFPFGPALALGVVITFLGWAWIGPRFQILLFNDTLMLILAAMCCVFMVVAGFVLRVLRLLRA
jgi:leader peptidase (prepilin peptidase)/N-methyltransferase